MIWKTENKTKRKAITLPNPITISERIYIYKYML